MPRELPVPQIPAHGHILPQFVLDVHGSSGYDCKASSIHGIMAPDGVGDSVSEEVYDVRAYQSMPVTEEVLFQVLEAGQLAPTAANRQAFQLVVVHTAG